MENRYRKPSLAAFAAAALACAAAPAQDGPPAADTAPPGEAELARPPEIDARRETSGRPGGARLAEPRVRDASPREEVVVVGEQRWRLPDLGSELRREQERESDARIRAEFLRPYDPADPANRFEPYPLDGELTRVGFIEIFRIGFEGP